MKKTKKNKSIKKTKKNKSMKKIKIIESTPNSILEDKFNSVSDPYGDNH